jgi:hypothetical protein
VLANANHAGKRLDDQRHKLIVEVCNEILAGQHRDMFPLHVWMTGSGTQFNMNVNEVISNRCCQLASIQNGSMTTNRSLRRAPPRRQRRLYQQLHFAASPAWDRRFELAVPYSLNSGVLRNAE